MLSRRILILGFPGVFCANMPSYLDGESFMQIDYPIGISSSLPGIMRQPIEIWAFI